MNAKKYFLGILLGVAAMAATPLSAQCPNISIRNKNDHIPNAIHQMQHWDTAVTCANPSIVLRTDAFVTTQNFNGIYTVESIPYNPPDPTFQQGTRLSNITADDIWDNSWMTFDFPFQFFGVTKNKALVGPNGLISFKYSLTPGSHCAYNYNVPIPNSNFVSSPDNSYGAIYGVYEDIDPGATQTTYGNYTNPGPHQNWGIYKFVGGEEPCRYLSTSVNDVVLFGNNSESCTYSIVCWEGTNIIDVYVKHRSCCSSTNGGKGIIGIMDSMGTSAFVAPNRGNQSGGWTGETDNEAWRFTPQGNTFKNVQWWMLTPEGDSIEIGQSPNDPAAAITHAYYLPAPSPDSLHMNCVVSPTVTTRYKATIKYNGATGYFYYLCDTITVGVDTSTQMHISTPDRPASSPYAKICFGQRAQFNLEIPTTLSAQEISWSVSRLRNGVRTMLPATAYSTANQNYTLFVQPNDGMIANHIDTLTVYSTVQFTNGCSNNDSVVLLIYPNFDITYTDGICQGAVYPKWGQQFTTTGDYSKSMTSTAGCDSIEHLSLTVFTKSITIDTVVACKPYTWQNGKTYYESNSATAAIDTILLPNRYGCDSTVRLNFTLIPIEARIIATPSAATMDNLTIQLSDISLGNDSRLWTFPDGSTNNNATCAFAFPSNLDSALISLHVESVLECSDDTTLMLHLLKESFYVPNAFMPQADYNNCFAPIGVGIIQLEVYIYNRRGNLVYHSDDLHACWDGHDLSGELCQQGTYTYIMRYVNVINPAAVLTKKGTVTLLR